MPSLLITYKSSSKTKKGEILGEIINVTQGKYTTVRNRLMTGTFPYPDKKLLCDFYKCDMEELFPAEPAL